MKSETFAAPEGICLFCDETEDLETVNLDGWNEEVCESCLDPNNWASETFESETNWYSRYGMEIKGFSEPPYTKMGYVVRHPEPSSKMIGDLYEIRPRLIRRYTSSEGLTEVEGYEIPWWYWVDEDSEPISSGKFFNTLDEALRWLKDNPDLQPSVEWEQGHAAETFNAYDPADAWDNFMHQQEMALEAYQEYLDYSGEDPLMTFEEWMEWQADLEDEYLQQQWEEMQEEDEPSPEDDPEYTTLEGTLDSETFESPVSCKICGKTFDSFRGLNGHMNAHLPSHRKRAEECEHEWQMTELPLERGHKYHVGWVNAAGIPSYHMVCIKCNYCTDCSGTHGFLAETFEAPKKTKQEIITYMLSNCEDWDEYSYRYTVNDEQWTLADLFIRQWLNNGWDGFGMNNVEEVYRYLVDNKELLIEYDLVSPDGINNSGIPLWDNYDFEAETFAAEYCPTCQIPEHDSCSLTDGCPCCEDTMIGIYRRAEDEGQTIEDFFVDMSDLLTKYSGGNWDWDSEAHDGVLGFSGNLTPTNGENFYQYDLDFDEIRADVSFEARGTSGWKVTCSKCGGRGHNKATCGRPKAKARKPRSTKSKGYVRKTIDKDDVRRNDILKAIGAVVVGIFIGRNL